MPLSKESVGEIIKINDKANKLYKQGGDEALLMGLYDIMPKVMTLIDQADNGEIDYYCNQYEGFCRAMKLLENIASGCRDGIFDDIIK